MAEPQVTGDEKEIEKDGERKHLRPTRELELFPSDVEAKETKRAKLQNEKYVKVFIFYSFKKMKLAKT